MKKKILFGITNLKLGGAERVLVDIVNNMVLELELVDPHLFIETIPTEKERIDVYKRLVNCIKDKLK